MKIRRPHSLLALAALLLAVLTAVVTVSPASATTHRTQPPGNVHVVLTKTTATVSWSAPPGHVLGYYLSRDGHDSHGGGFYSTVISPSRRSFTFLFLIPGAVYHFELAAKTKLGGWSPKVNIVSRMPGGHRPPPPPPPHLNLSVDVQAINSLQPYGLQYDDSGPSFNQGGYDCALHYHEYLVTTGCGGAWADVEVQNLAAFRGGLSSSGTINISADLGRTFGCVDPDGTFHTATVITETQHPFDWVHADGNFAPGFSEDPTSNDMHAVEFVNFQPVRFRCGPTQTEEQLGLKVSNATITVTDSVTGTVTAHIPGPWYSPPVAPH